MCMNSFILVFAFGIFKVDHDSLRESINASRISERGTYKEKGALEKELDNEKKK